MYVDYNDLKDKQKDVITALFKGKDVFVSLPTASGKSLCFALIPKVVDKLKKTLYLSSEQQSVCIIFSSLMSLMDDQVCSSFL